MRSIHHRLTRLEKVHADEPKHCHSCGFPGTGVRRVILTDHAEPMPTCECYHRPLDEDGLPLFTPYARIILASEVKA